VCALATDAKWFGKWQVAQLTPILIAACALRDWRECVGSSAVDGVLGQVKNNL
jgi:hypothetical protein